MPIASSTEVDEAEFARLKGFGIDLERASGRSHHAIAVPSLFVIDGKGVVRWAHANLDYKVRPSTVQILAAIDGLTSAWAWSWKQAATRRWAAVKIKAAGRAEAAPALPDAPPSRQEGGLIARPVNDPTGDSPAGP